MPDLNRDGVTLHYEIEGTGPALLLIAGMMSDSASWLPLVQDLARHFTVIRPDNRTTGRTTPWNAPVTVQTVAEDAAAILEAEGHSRAHLVGHSMGGLAAMEATGIMGDRLASVTIMATAQARFPRLNHVFETMARVRAHSSDPSDWLRVLYPFSFAPAFFNDPKAVDTALQAALAYPYMQSMEAFQHQMQMLMSFRPTVRPKDIRQPAQVLLAEHDLMIPADEARAAFKDFSGPIHIIEGAGHSLHWDQPQATAEAIIAFAGAHDL